MVIRGIRIDDAAAFWQMQYELDKETKYMLYKPKERQKNIELINSIIGKAVKGDNLILVAEVKDEIVGYIFAQRGAVQRTKHSAYIVIGIRSVYQGQGIGSQFFARLNIWAKEQGLTRLELTVMCENKKAVHLYEKNGFIIEGIKRNSMLVDGEYQDEYYMAKLL